MCFVFSRRNFGLISKVSPKWFKIETLKRSGQERHRTLRDPVTWYKIKHAGKQVRPVHIQQEKSENAALFLRSGLASSLIHNENGAFRKRASDTIILFPWPSFQQRQIQNDQLLLRFEIIRVDETHLMHFQSETSISKSLRSRVNRTGPSTDRGTSQNKGKFPDYKNSRL